MQGPAALVEYPTESPSINDPSSSTSVRRTSIKKDNALLKYEKSTLHDEEGKESRISLGTTINPVNGQRE